MIGSLLQLLLCFFFLGKGCGGPRFTRGHSLIGNINPNKMSGIQTSSNEHQVWRFLARLLLVSKLAATLDARDLVRETIEIVLGLRDGIAATACIHCEQRSPRAVSAVIVHNLATRPHTLHSRAELVVIISAFVSGQIVAEAVAHLIVQPASWIWTRRAHRTKCFKNSWN